MEFRTASPSIQGIDGKAGQDFYCLGGASLFPRVCLPDWSRRLELMSSSLSYAYPLSRVDILVSQA
jgi:hypothetical protein